MTFLEMIKAAFAAFLGLATLVGFTGFLAAAGFSFFTGNLGQGLGFLLCLSLPTLTYIAAQSLIGD